MSSPAAVDHPLIVSLFTFPDYQPELLHKHTNQTEASLHKRKGFFRPHYHTGSTIAPFVLSKSVIIEHPIDQLVLFGESFICKLEHKYHTVSKSGFIKSCVDNR